MNLSNKNIINSFLFAGVSINNLIFIFIIKIKI